MNSAKETKSSIDVMLKNRFDLLPNLVATVKGYMKHEAEVLEKLTAMRTWANDIQLDNQVWWAIKTIFAVAENYPNLKANENFLLLQVQIGAIEDKLQAARRTYNAAVKYLLDKKMMFPSNIIASNMDIPEFPMFEATTEERLNPWVAGLDSK
jgi:LemA protein